MRFGLFLLCLFFTHLSLAAVSFEQIAKEHISIVEKKYLQNITTKSLDQAVKFLTATDKYSFVTAIKQNNGNYIITGTPFYFINNVSIINANEVAQSSIRNEAKLNKGDKYSSQNVKNSIDQILNFYKSLGYFNVQIEPEAEFIDNNLVNLTLNISEHSPAAIEDIEFSTTNESLKKNLNDLVSDYIGETFSIENQKRINNDIKTYLKEQRYLTANLSEPNLTENNDKTKVKLFYDIKKAEKFEVVLLGNEKINSLMLYTHLNLDEFKSAQFEPSQKLSNMIKDFYLERGYAQVKVTSETKKKKNSTWVLIKRKEGPRVKIKNIEVKGRISRSSSYYENFILQNSTPLIDRGYYNEKGLELGYNNLITELQNQGYLKAKIITSRTDINFRGDATVYLNLDEGPLTQIRKIEFLNSKEFTYSKLLEVIEMSSNSPLSLKKLEAGAEKLTNFYKSMGFLEMQIQNNNKELVSYNSNSTEAYIKFNIYEGPKITIKKIVYEGNTFTKDKVITNEISFQKGQTLTPDLMEENLSRLNALGIFSSVEITTLERNTTIADRTLIISVSERDPGLLTFGVGANSERGLTVRGFSGISYNNLWGTARGVSLRVELANHIKELNYLTHKVTLGYLEPFLLDSRNRGRINLTRLRTLFKINDDGSARVQDSNRLDLLLERDLTSDLKLTWTVYSLDSRDFFDIKTPDGTNNKTTKQIVLIGPTLDYDTRDNPFLPTEGIYARWSYDYSSEGLGSSEGIAFYRTQAVLSHYIQLGSPSLIWANSIRGGYLENISSRPGSAVPSSHIFYLGGSSSLRGFDASNANDRLPQDYLFDEELVEREELIEHNSKYYLLKSELRFPIIDAWGGVLFYDAGAVEIAKVYQPQAFRQSAGLGVRYNTPVGPVNVEMAYKLNSNGIPDRDETMYRFHFSIGTF